MKSFRGRLVLLICISLMVTSISSLSFADTISDNGVEIGAFGVSDDEVSEDRISDDELEDMENESETNDSEEISDNEADSDLIPDDSVSEASVSEDSSESENSISDSNISDNVVDYLGVSEDSISEDDLCGYNPLPEEDYAEVIDGIYKPEEDPNLENITVFDSNIDEDALQIEDGLMAYSLIDKSDIEALGEEGLPVEYSTSDNMLSPLRNQVSNTCWAYSSMAMAEASMMSQGYYDKSAGENYSEYHLAYFSYNKPKDSLGGINNDVNKIKDSSRYNIYSVGGNYILAQNILAAWIGAAEDSKYQMTGGVYAIDSSKAQDDVAHLKGYYNININNDRDNAKRLIMEFGAVGISYHSNKTSYYNPNYNAYYCSTNQQSNHAVCVVGWNDNFDRANFRNNDGIENDGAWLVRNSYTSVDNKYCYEGYFWLSYEDKSLKDEAYCFIFEPASLHDNNYQYDGGMYSRDFTISNSTTVYGANVFTAKANADGETLDSVSFYNPKADCTYQVSVYKITDPKKPNTGTRIANKSGDTTFAGYYSISFDSPVYLKKGDMFSVVVKLTTKDGTYARLACEGNYNSSTGFFVSSVYKEANQSFYSYSGSKWDDVTGLNSIGNVRIKAQTSNVILPREIRFNSNAINLDITKSHDLQYQVIPANADDISVTWSSSDPSVATVSDTGIINSIGPGTAIITAKANMGGVKNTCQVTVRDTFDVGYVLNGGVIGAGSPTLYSYNAGSSVALVEPAKPGYTFDGWYQESDFSGVAINEIPRGAVGDYMLYAKWTPISSTLIFDYNESSYDPVPTGIVADDLSMSKLVTYDSEVGPLPFLKSTNRTFAGWFDAPVGGEAVSSEQLVDFTSDKTIYAQWTDKSKIVVRLNAEGGSIANSKLEIDVGDRYGSISSPVRLRYVFNGWFTAPTGGDKITETSEAWILGIEGVDIDQELYAQYTPIGFETSSVDVTVKKKVATMFNQPGATYKTSNKKVATVDASGIVKGIKKGTATITATHNGQKYTCKVKVYNKPVMTGVNQLKVKKSKKFKVKDGYGTIIWTSSNPAVATVDQKGKVKAVKKGKTVITAYRSGYKMKIKLKVIK